MIYINTNSILYCGEKLHVRWSYPLNIAIAIIMQAAFSKKQWKVVGMVLNNQIEARDCFEQSNWTCFTPTIKLNIRVRWIWSKMIKLLKIKTGHLYSYVKLNFKASLFSCIFWFEAIFIGKWALLVFRPYSSKNVAKTIENERFLKIGLKPTQKC